MSKSWYRLLEVGGILVTLLLPVYFNPFTSQIEAAKVNLFQAITISMAGIAGFRLFVISPPVQKFWSGEVLGRQMLFVINRERPLLFAATLYGGTTLLATAVSINPRLSFWGLNNKHGTLTTLSVLIFFLLMEVTLRQKRQVDRMITMLLLGSVPVCLYGWIQYLGVDALQWISTSISPVAATMGRSIFLGSYLAMLIPFTLSRMIGGEHNGRKRPAAYGLILTLQIGCLLFTMARGAWLGFTGGVVLFLWLLAYQQHNRKMLVISCIVLIFCGYLFIQIYQGAGMNSLTGLSQSQIAHARMGSNRERVMIWQHTLALISDRFLFGYGPETFTSILRSAYSGTPSQLSLFAFEDPHNLFLSRLFASGIFGLIALIWLLLTFYRKLIAILRYSRNGQAEIVIAAIISSITAFLIQAQFNPDVIVLTALFWLILALGAAMYRFESHPA